MDIKEPLSSKANQQFLFKMALVGMFATAIVVGAGAAYIAYTVYSCGIN